MKRLVFVATEGARTEPIYFEALKRQLGRGADTSIKTLPPEDGDSSPKDVLGRLRKAVRGVQLHKNDECWVVVDRDTWDSATLKSVASACEAVGWGFALSNPCFELWLTLHLPQEKTPLGCGDCEAELVKQLGSYAKTEYDADALVANVDVAIQRAKRLEAGIMEQLPGPPYTKVHQLVGTILAPVAS